MSRHIIAPIAAGVLLALAGAAQAATKTSSFTVSASVGKNCIINAAPLALGEFLGDNDLFANSNITVRCTDGTGFSIALNAGNTGSYAGRRMVGPGGVSSSTTSTRPTPTVPRSGATTRVLRMS